ncbi:hypothetical protein COX26_02410 [Candidatus Jorgensenbacteria bacterium CG23_combo_of_CG06-09_8_20_14_all_54_14]|uniref:Uncharacterized protein n=1 Tax=Candidatus Jorgensenbacteria bacterium CG23_combo_of_CG06-09_8_20_14_all_54_14 TaxID=1974595 RepID=A0A2G9Z9D4_9BACT|nr:MAG: hypothetical protein COX26_02410 [Candidatus Jorgensenbacteria bacterium CG23_combo_of_CG06-09_8_20_14_all_54_14]
MENKTIGPSAEIRTHSPLIEFRASQSSEREVLSSAFEERKRELQRSKNIWRNWFLANIVLLFCVALFMFFELSATAGFTAVLWLELALVLPLVYSAIFFHAQHNRDREYLEEYSFKSVVARSLDAYRTLLKEEVGPGRAEERKKLLDFLVDAVKKLYTSPRAIISKHPVKSEEDVKVGMVEKFGDIFKKFIPKI